MSASTSEYNFVINLIDSVRENKCLYAKSDQSYYNKLIKAKSWESIAEICQRPAAECKNKWKSIRERYARELRKLELQSETGSASDQEQWLHFEKLEFLRDSMTSRRSQYESLTIPLGNNENAYGSMEDTDFDEQFVDISSFSTRTSLKRERDSCEVPSKRLRETVKREEEESQMDSLATSTADELFARTIVSLMKDLPVAFKDKFQLDMYQRIFQLRAEFRGDH